MTTLKNTTQPLPAAPANMAGAARGGLALESALQQIRDVCSDHGIGDPHALTTLVGSQHADTALFLFHGGGDVPARAQIRELGHDLEESLDLTEPLTLGLDKPIVRLAHAMRAAFAGGVIVLCTWIVVGAAITSQNAMAAHTSAAFVLSLLAGTLIALALLEAAHIGAVALSSADVSELRLSHPRVFRLHRHINTKEKLEEYLAARQVGVVLLVFVIAEVTRTAGMTTLPGTAIAIPAAAAILFQVGAPGALMVLVIGQVAPQVLTARRPAALMNSPLMAAAFTATRAIGHLGLALPAKWLVSWSTETERIPSAPRSRFLTTALDIEGHSVQLLRRELRIGPSRSESCTEAAIAVHQDSLGVLGYALSMSRSPNDLDVAAVVQRDGSSVPVTFTKATEKTSRPAYAHFPYDFTPQVGTYHPTDTLSVVMTAGFEAPIYEDVIAIDAPTKLVMLTVRFEEPPVPLTQGILTITRQGDGDVLSTIALEPIVEPDGLVVLHAKVAYPDTGTIIKISWR